MKKLNLQFFSDNKETDNTQTEETAEQQTTAESEKTETKEPPKDETKQDKTIPYDRFKQVNDDLKAFKQTFESLGLEGIDSLKGLVEDYNAKKKSEEERQRAEMSEIERLQADLKAKEEAELTYKQQVEEMQKSFEQEKIHNAFITKAQAANIAYVDDALALADLSAVKLGENGVEGVDEVISSLIENKPFLLAQEKKQPKPIGDSSNNTSQDEVKTLEAQLEEAKSKNDFNKVIEISNKIKQVFKK